MLIEFRWHGRGGQGTVVGAKLLAEAANSKNYFVQALPEFGPERRGAPVQSYNRFSDKPILLHTPVKNPDYIIIVDSSLIGSSEITAGLKKETIFIVNTKESPKSLREKLGVESKLYTINATGIAIETIGRAIPNTPLLGAISKVSGLIDIEDLIEIARESFKDKYDEKTISGNIEALRRGFEEVMGP